MIHFVTSVLATPLSRLANDGDGAVLAWQERYFCSFVQRVLDEPLDMRLHYGHPDLLLKIHFLTRGGVSKASREINLSEDVRCLRPSSH